LQTTENTLGARTEFGPTGCQQRHRQAGAVGVNAGWFSASFGPFRRFTGGDRDFERLFFTNPRLAPHLSAFGEDVALTEGLQWLQQMHVRSLEAAAPSPLLDRMREFLNRSSLLPHGATISEVRSDQVIVLDGARVPVAIEQMSDGYRSVLSMIIEIFRQMSIAYGEDKLVEAIDVSTSIVNLPGVVSIDEVDAHLHPSWQRDIGPWFVKCFPKIQFLVTTHSPIICRAAKTVWRLSSPGSTEQAGRIAGTALDRLIYGSIVDAFGTDFFGHDIARSPESKELLAELAQLNRKSLRGSLTDAERERVERLRAALPSQASATAEP
jgi:Predicted ATP-binding protein involved in virulence